MPPGLVADVNGTPIMEDIDPPAPCFLSSCRWGNTTKWAPTRATAGLRRRHLERSSDRWRCVGAPSGTRAGNHCVATYNIETFMDTALIRADDGEWLRMLKSTKPTPRHDRVLSPGLQKLSVKRKIRPKGFLSTAR